MDFPYHQKIFSEDETKSLAEKFADKLSGNETVVLNGNLGAGKTFFIKRMINYLNKGEASSPTFSLVNEFEGEVKIYHFDFYRINDVEELYDIGIDEYLSGDGIKLIEWGNLFPEVLPKKRIEINIDLNEDFSRDISINKL